MDFYTNGKENIVPKPAGNFNEKLRIFDVKEL